MLERSVWEGTFAVGQATYPQHPVSHVVGSFARRRVPGAAPPEWWETGNANANTMTFYFFPVREVR